MNTVKQFLFFLWIVLIPFQDTGLQALPIGFLGSAPAFIPLALLLLITFCEWLAKGNLRINRGVVYAIIYVLCVTVVYLALFGTRSHGTSLIFKSFNLSILTGLLILPVPFLDFGTERIARYVRNAFLVAVAGVVLADILKLEFLASSLLLHFHENRNMRPRGFSLESSTLAVTIITLGLLAAHFSRSWLGKVSFLLTAVLVTLYSASKGGLIILFIVAAIFIFSARHIRLWPKIALTLSLVVLSYFAVGVLQRNFLDDLDLYTSTSTRAGLVTTSIVTFIHNPLGVGFSGFLPAVDRYAPDAVDFLNRTIPGTLNFAEILSYVGADTDMNISTKTLLFDNLLYFGLPFLILFILFHKRLLAGLKQPDMHFLYGAVLFSLIALCTVTGGVGLYNFTLVYGIAWNVICCENSSDRNA
jgi:hypothetical protein